MDWTRSSSQVGNLSGFPCTSWTGRGSHPLPSTCHRIQGLGRRWCWSGFGFCDSKSRTKSRGHLTPCRQNFPQIWEGAMESVCLLRLRLSRSLWLKRQQPAAFGNPGWPRQFLPGAENRVPARHQKQTWPSQTKPNQTLHPKQTNPNLASKHPNASYRCFLAHRSCIFTGDFSFQCLFSTFW